MLSMFPRMMCQLVILRLSHNNSSYKLSSAETPKDHDFFGEHLTRKIFWDDSYLQTLKTLELAVNRNELLFDDTIV
jgi:hypothetical protein